GEGNGFSPWSGDHSEGVYQPENSYEGSFYYTEAIDEALADGCVDQEEIDKMKKAIVLWPNN
ncbi:hypothetical protein OE165_28800, partial [Escherichia coli]|uniref:hypothetical protein n=1 Tax=Escherichia coli TaxID=562 RepID=UPI0021F2C449